MGRPMTMQGKVRECAKNALLSRKQGREDLCYYWVSHLKNHMSSKDENGSPIWTLRSPVVISLVNRALALKPVPSVPLAPPPFPVKPKTYTLSEEAITRIAEGLAEMIHERARKTGESLSPVAEAVRQSVEHHIKKEATCN